MTEVAHPGPPGRIVRCPWCYAVAPEDEIAAQVFWAEHAACVPAYLREAIVRAWGGTLTGDPLALPREVRDAIRRLP